MKIAHLLGAVAVAHSSRCLVTAKSVFAHFMVDNASNYTLGDWTTDIGLAQQAHIDAFALNVAYRDNLESILPVAFQAATNLGFKLFFSFDYAGNGAWPKDNVSTILSTYRTLPAYFAYKGKYFVSTFEGPDSADDWVDLKSQYNIFFMPDWSSLGAKEALTRGGGVADGLFSWAAWPWGPQDMDTYTDASYLQYLNGKPYMMPVSPWFFTNLPGYNKNWLWRGDSLWYDRWVQAAFNKTTPGIIDSTEFIEIISWNDYGESHYIGPLYEHAMEAFAIGRAPSNFAKDMPHDGWRMFLPYVIDLFKAGTATITQEGLTAWYRLSPGAACVSTSTTGNTASQLQVEFSPAEVVQDKIFFSALLASEASIMVTVGGVQVSGGDWTWKPDDRIGVYHGSVPFSNVGDVVVTLTRNGAQIAQIHGPAIVSGCPPSLYNAWVGSAAVAGSLAKKPTLPISQQTCVSGIGANNFGGLCGYACQFGYCPITACTCRQMGKPLTAPKETGVQGYPIAGEDASYSGLCSWVCNHGYCPSTACGTTKVPLTVPNVSDFAPPACRQGTGQGGLLGLCQYSCNLGFCPRNACTCTEQGALINSPPDQGLIATAITGLEDHGLCNFACNKGYCPDVCVSTPQPSALEDDFEASLKLNNILAADFATYNLSNLATRLVGWKDCEPAKGKPRQAVYSGWQQSWKLMNLMYTKAKKGLNLNEASAVEYLGPPGFTSKRKRDFEAILLNLATIQPGWIPFPGLDWNLAVRCDDWARECSCIPGERITMAYTTNYDPKYHIASITFCDAYFAADTLDQVMRNADKGLGVDWWADMGKYAPNQGAVWFHELLHIDWVSLAEDYGDNEHVTDVRLVFRNSDEDAPPDRHFAYGAYFCKSLARFFKFGQSTADWTIRNADSMTFYALANYVQNKMGNLYPHLPLAPRPPDNVLDNFEAPGLFSMSPDGTVTWLSNTTLGGMDGVCGAGDDVDSSNTDQSAFATVVAGDFALESDFPSEYLSSWSSWAGLTPTTSQSAPTPTATWTIAIYSDTDCSGDYYSLEGHNEDTPLNECLVLRGGKLPQISDTGVSCRWFTKGGGAWAGCESSTLTHPLSWRIRHGSCAAYESDTCSYNSLSQAYSSYEGCYNYGSRVSDLKHWVSLKCGAVSDKQFGTFNGTAGVNGSTTWSNSSRPVSVASIPTLRTSYMSSLASLRPTATETP